VTVGPPRPPRGDIGELAERFRAAADPVAVGDLARRLGVAADALRRLGIGWCAASRAWSLPMSDGSGRVVGIRLRTAWGHKFAVAGSREGLFVPAGLDPAAPLWVAEGESDTAALLTLDLPAVGRPGCSGGTAPLVELVRRRRPAEVVVVSDRDDHERGQVGARELAVRLALACPAVRILLPPPGVKDARAWIIAGETRTDVLAAARAATPVRVSVTSRPARVGGRNHGD
jgi:hypothetical protein